MILVRSRDNIGGIKRNVRLIMNVIFNYRVMIIYFFILPITLTNLMYASKHDVYFVLIKMLKSIWQRVFYRGNQIVRSGSLDLIVIIIIRIYVRMKVILFLKIMLMNHLLIQISI